MFSQVYFNKFWKQITPFFICSAGLSLKELEKILLGRSALCIRVSLDPVTFLMTMLVFLELSAKNLPSDLS